MDAYQVYEGRVYVFLEVLINRETKKPILNYVLLSVAHVVGALHDADAQFQYN